MASTISKKRLTELNAVLGLDCSKYQKDIDWSKAKAAGIMFAFIKITEGTSVDEVDQYNVKNRALEAQKNGVKIGYYHFARPGNVSIPENDANEEVFNVLAHLAVLPKADLPLVLDLEAYAANVVWDNKIDHMNKFITTFINGLKQHNISTIFYSYKSFVDINSSPIFGVNPLWLAGYPSNPEVSLPLIPNGWKEWKIWQFTDKGIVDGYNGNIDLNIMKVDYFNLF